MTGALSKFLKGLPGGKKTDLSQAFPQGRTRSKAWQSQEGKSACNTTKPLPPGGSTGDSLLEKSPEVYKQGLVKDLVQGNI